jgi:hypothetical protein
MGVVQGDFPKDAHESERRWCPMSQSNWEEGAYCPENETTFAEAILKNC